MCVAVCLCPGVVLFVCISDVFVRQCHFLRQTGHSEKAVCLFQALIEFTFFKPDSVRDLTTKQQVHTHTHLCTCVRDIQKDRNYTIHYYRVCVGGVL